MSLGLFPGAEAGQPRVVAVPGKPVLLLGDYDLAAQGYAEREFFVSGRATAYRAGRDAAGNPVGRRSWGWRRAYTTRIVVLTPLDPRRFNGTVVVEWLNVSTGRDIPAEWIMLHREMLRAGYAYVAVSAQRIARATGQKQQPAGPGRYAGLSLPGDAYSFDVFSDAGRLLKTQPAALLGGLRPDRLLGAGYSQSAFYLTTYVNWVDPVARVYDGFLIQSRPGAAPGLDWSSLYSASRGQAARPVRLRADLRVPVVQVITETDLTGLAGFIGYYAARQPDTPHLRSWEIAGAAHVDNYLMAGGMLDTPQQPLRYRAETWAPRQSFGDVRYPALINNAPQYHYVAEAALARLNLWVATGLPPPHGAPVDLNAARLPAVRRDENGNALGGIRTPWEDVPISALSGQGGMLGSVAPFDARQLARLYPGGRAQYMRAFAAALDGTIAAGFLLPADRGEILSLAAAGYP